MRSVVFSLVLLLCTRVALKFTRFQPIRYALFFHVHYYAQSNLRYFLVEDSLKSVVQQGPETKTIGFFCIREDKASQSVEMEASLFTFPELQDINVSLPSGDASLLSFSSFSSSAVLSALKKILALFSEKQTSSNSCKIEHRGDNDLIFQLQGILQSFSVVGSEQLYQI